MGMEDHLEELKKRKQELLDLEVGTKGRKKKLRKIRRKIRKVERQLGERLPAGKGDTGGSSKGKKKKKRRGRRRTEVDEETLNQALEQVVSHFEEIGLPEHKWDEIEPKKEPYGFSLLDMVQLEAGPEDLITKFKARWEDHDPEWYLVTHQGKVPIVLLGPTPELTYQH